MQSYTLDRIEAADLAPAVFRTAVRLARLTADGAHVLLNYEEIAAICGTTSDNTVRGHLGALHRAGLFDYKRNSAVTVWWLGAPERGLGAPSCGEAYSRPPINLIADRSNRSVDDQQPCNDDTAQRSVCDQIDRTQINLIAHRSDGAIADPASDENPVQRSMDDQFDRPQINLITGRSNRSVGDQPNTGLTTTTSRLAGLDLKASQPAGKESEENQPPVPDQARTMAMLTDDAIGLDQATALRLCAKYPPGRVLATCCRYLRDLAVGKVNGPSVIAYRLRKDYGASITPADMRTDYYARHGDPPPNPYVLFDDGDEPLSASPMLLPKPARRPKAAPGTPEATWQQLQSDFALHQPVGSADSIIQDAWVIAYDDGLFTIGITDAFRLDWVEKKLRNQIKRRLAIIMGRNDADVHFVVDAESRRADEITTS
jgi:hypothetical protein